MPDHGVSSHDRTTTQRHPLQDRGFGRHPAVGTDMDRGDGEPAGRRRRAQNVVVVTNGDHLGQGSAVSDI